MECIPDSITSKRRPSYIIVLIYCPDANISQMYQQVIFSESATDAQKNGAVLVFSEFDKRLVDGADEQLSILDMALRISELLSKS